MFDVAKLKAFDWPDLDGKELTMVYATDSGTAVLVGYEKSTGITYVIGSKQEAAE